VDVARLAGVGTTTVTKVIRERRHVSAATRLRVLEAIAALDYHPSEVGRSLRTGVTRVIGVITAPPSTHPLTYAFFPYLLEGIGERAAASDYDVLWITAGSLRRQTSPYASLFKNCRVDGIIDAWLWLGQSRVSHPPASGHPVIVIGHPDDAHVPHVDAANRDGASQVGHAFLIRKYHPVAYVGFRESPASRDRLQGLRQALTEAGQEIHSQHVTLFEREQSYLRQEHLGYVCMRNWIEQQAVPRAILAYTDQIGWGIMRACRESGLSVPEDVAVVGFDDEPASQHLQPPLASVAQPIRDLGYQAAEMLLQLLDGSPLDVPTRVLPTVLVERESLSPAPQQAFAAP
jgi:DNA-binding LacI/PurR family transcriptional regulator